MSRNRRHILESVHPRPPELRDSELVVDQVNGVSAVRQAHLGELHEVASSLVALFESIRISWVPREMNAEADRLVNDALGALD
jgi:ribonuclease H / adenosylcobalamin/alpha-ribazole phosphatase